jgi:hypothetical protein
MRRGTGILLALAALLAVPAATPAEPTAPQRLFAQKLLDDPKTTEVIKDLLRTGGFVDETITFRDLTKDGRDDAVVRVQSGGASGIVAVYVFSSDGDADAELDAVFRSQSLTRASTKVSQGKVSYRYARYSPADELCCPSRIDESRLQWKAKQGRFVVAKRVQIIPAP